MSINMNPSTEQPDQQPPEQPSIKLNTGASKLDIFRHAFAVYGGSWEYVNPQWINKSARLLIIPSQGFDALPRTRRTQQRDSYLLLQVSKNKQKMSVLRRFVIMQQSIVDKEV